MCDSVQVKAITLDMCRFIKAHVVKIVVIIKLFVFVVLKFVRVNVELSTVDHVVRFPPTLRKTAIAWLAEFCIYFCIELDLNFTIVVRYQRIPGDSEAIV